MRGCAPLCTEAPTKAGLLGIFVLACAWACTHVYWTGIGPGCRRARGRRMPRKVRDANLETRTARSRLPVRHKPFFRLIEPGLHLGYRKLTSGPGTWLVRRYRGEGRYVVDNLRTPDGELILADDFEDSDGQSILDFAQAQRAARGPRQRTAGGYTVANAIADYLRFLESDGRSPHSIRDTRCRVAAFVLPELGAAKVAGLTTDRLRRWRDDLVKAPPRRRTRKGEDQQYTSDSSRRGRQTGTAGLGESNVDDPSKRAQPRICRGESRERSGVAEGEAVSPRRCCPHSVSVGCRGQAAYQCGRPGLPPAGAGRAANWRALWRVVPAAGARFQPRRRHARHSSKQERQGTPRRPHRRRPLVLCPAGGRPRWQ